MASFRNVKVEQILSAYGEFIQSKESLEKIYNGDSKLTIDTNNILGVDKIVEFLKKEAKDFQLQSFTALPYDDHAIIATGKCIWGNSQKIFSFVFQENSSNIFITNQIIN